MALYSMPLLFPEMRIKKRRIPYVSPKIFVTLQRSLSWCPIDDLPLSNNELAFIDELYAKEDHFLDLSLSS